MRLSDTDLIGARPRHRPDRIRYAAVVILALAVGTTLIIQAVRGDAGEMFGAAMALLAYCLTYHTGSNHPRRESLK